MPQCESCSSSFPNKAVIDGKERVLSSRKYCLNCSPFGGHNTRNPAKVIGEIVACVCSRCSRKYDFNPKRKQGHTLERCNSCGVNTRRFSLKERCIAYMGGSCSRCGYNKSKRALSFHHKDPTQKKFQISGKHCFSWEKIRVELDKCIMLCANCHMEDHEEESNLTRKSNGWSINAP